LDDVSGNKDKVPLWFLVQKMRESHRLVLDKLSLSHPPSSFYSHSERVGQVPHPHLNTEYRLATLTRLRSIAPAAISLFGNKAAKKFNEDDFEIICHDQLRIGCLRGNHAYLLACKAFVRWRET
jgi:hypothetical protein